MKIADREPILKGWSNDKKYCMTDENGERFLLRVSELAQYDAKQSEFSMMQRVAALSVPMCLPIEFGVCEEGVYSVQSWIDGESAEERIPLLPSGGADPAQDPFHPRAGFAGGLGRPIQSEDRH